MKSSKNSVKIHSTSIIHPTAEIDFEVEIGPYSIIGPKVRISSGTKIFSNVVIKGPTTIGKNNMFFQFASIGEDPQDKKYQDGSYSELVIGDGNTFREFCTMNRGTEQGGGKTSIGNDNLFMAYTHVAHDCLIGNNVIFSNNASIAGHVVVGNNATLGGLSGVHQFCKIGEYSFVAGGAIVFKDVSPFVIVSGCPAVSHGLNTVGLERHGFNTENILNLRRAYKTLFRSNFTVDQALKELEPLINQYTEVRLITDFFKNSKRGVVR